MKQILSRLFSSLLVASALCGGAVTIAPAFAAQSQSPLFDLQGPVTVTKVTDGDSLRVGPLRIRVFGIDAPESKQFCRAADGTEWACGLAATTAMRDIVAQVDQLHCHLRDTDRYGRLVMQCFAGEVDIAAALTERGLALAYRRFSTDYVAAETDARAAKKGMWAGDFLLPWEWRKAQ